MNPSQLQNHFDAFYEDFWCEMCKYGEIEEVVVCDNNNDRKSPVLSSHLSDHTLTSPTMHWHWYGTDLIGNVYARFKYEDSAQKACDALNSRWYAARPIYCELSPVTDFREACCRLNSGEGCVRGGFCNFIHRKEPSPELDRELELGTKKWLRSRGRDEKSASRSPSPEPTRKRGWKGEFRVLVAVDDVARFKPGSWPLGSCRILEYSICGKGLGVPDLTKVFIKVSESINCNLAYARSGAIKLTH